MPLKKLRPREEVKDPGQSHIATKWRGPELTFDGVIFKPSALATYLLNDLCTVPSLGATEIKETLPALREFTGW